MLLTCAGSGDGAGACDAATPLAEVLAHAARFTSRGRESARALTADGGRDETHSEGAAA